MVQRMLTTIRTLMKRCYALTLFKYLFWFTVLMKSEHQRFRDCDPIFVGAGAVNVCAGLVSICQYFCLALTSSDQESDDAKFCLL